MSLLETIISNAVVVAVAVAIFKSFGWTCRSPLVRHAVWLLVLVKLFTPAIVPVPILPEGSRFHAESPPAIRATQPDGGADLELTTVELSSFTGAEPGTTDRIALDRESESSVWLESLLSSARHVFAKAGQSVSSFIAFWVAGSLVWMVLVVHRVRRFKSRLAGSCWKDSELQAVADRLAGRVGLNRCPKVLLVDARISPMLWGFGRHARILLPRELMEQLDSESRDAVILHELAHFRRGDHLVRLFEAACIAVFWWHPGVWIARRELQNAEEECCDAWVVSVMSGSGRRYAEALMQAVEFVSRTTSPSPVAPGASAIGGASLLKRRVEFIMNGHSRTRLSWAGRIAVLGFAVILLSFLPALSSDPAPGKEADGGSAAEATKLTVAEGPAEKQTDRSKKETSSKKQNQTAKSVARLFLETSTDPKTKATTTFVRLKGKRVTLAEFLRNFESLISVVEKDKAKRKTITLHIAAERTVSDGDVQKIISLSQNAGIEKFAIQVAEKRRPKPEEATKIEKLFRLELLADVEGRLTGMILDGENLGSGQKAFDLLVKRLTSDKRLLQGRPWDGMVIVADHNLVYSEVLRVINTVSELKVADGKAPALKRLTFAVRKKLPDVEGIVVSVKQKPGATLAEISIGADDGLEKGHSLWVYRVDPATKVKNYLGRIRIESVQPDRSVGSLVPNEKKMPLKKGDRVLSKLPPSAEGKTSSAARPGVIVARIRLVDESRQVLWINKGSEDGVKQSETLKVRGKPQKDGQPGEPKGTVTITRILAEHLAEARIESEKADDPIEPGDVLLSDK